jgi:hypothetical protein
MGVAGKSNREFYRALNRSSSLIGAHFYISEDQRGLVVKRVFDIDVRGFKCDWQTLAKGVSRRTGSREGREVGEGRSARLTQATVTPARSRAFESH